MKYMGNKQKIADEILTVIFNNSQKTDTLWIYFVAVVL